MLAKHFVLTMVCCVDVLCHAVLCAMAFRCRMCRRVRLPGRWPPQHPRESRRRSAQTVAEAGLAPAVVVVPEDHPRPRPLVAAVAVRP